MYDERFFRWTRGQILQLLRKRRLCTIDDLSESLGLSPNAIRQHVAVLERDGLIGQEALRRGRYKPCFAYSLTRAGDDVFPKRYDLLLRGLLREMADEDGHEKIARLFDRAVMRMVERQGQAFEGKPLEQRVALLASLLNAQGALLEHEEKDGTFVLKEYNCPYGGIPRKYPQICSSGVQLMERLLAARVEKVNCLQQGEGHCSFVVVPTDA